MDLEGAIDFASCKNQFEHLRRDGWAFFPGAVSNDLVAAAIDAIAHDCAHNYDPARQAEYDNISFCPNLRDKQAIDQLLTRSSARKLLDLALGWENVDYSPGQIAIRQAHNTDRPYPPVPHIDGTGNGRTPGSKVSNFTALVGVFLTRLDAEFAGNFTVWPGSHHLLEEHFRSRGPQAMLEGMPRIELGSPVQLMANPGDVVLCHYQLAHAAAVNLSPTDRIAVYFRVWLQSMRTVAGSS
jgi:hypothetical protein